jgi:tRNA nucleotidyltransferase (CCA-adding enzyme)
MGLSKVILPELDEVKDTLGLKKALKAVNKEAKTRWAVLCYYLESELNTGRNAETGSISKKVMHGLKFDNKTMDCVIRFLTVSGNNISDKDVRIYSRSLLNSIGEEDIYQYLDFADAVGCISGDSIGGYELLKNAIDDILEKKECFSLKQLAVNGRDIMKECDINGKQVGELLDFLLETVMVSPEKNSREVLIEEAKAYGKQQL